MDRLARVTCRWFVGAAVLSAALGCRKPHEATSGKEFFGKLQKAAVARDVETVWLMMTRECRNSIVNAAKGKIQIADLQERAELEDAVELPTRDPEQLARILLREGLEKKARTFAEMSFVDERDQDTALGKMYWVTFRHSEADRDHFVLLEVDGYLRLLHLGSLTTAVMGWEPPKESP
jgi:hypothetical protein